MPLFAEQYRYFNKPFNKSKRKIYDRESYGEKWGVMRFYFDCLPNKYFFNWTIIIVSESENICESCGNFGKLREYGWWHTTCDDCEKEYYSNYKEDNPDFPK